MINNIYVNLGTPKSGAFQGAFDIAVEFSRSDGSYHKLPDKVLDELNAKFGGEILKRFKESDQTQQSHRPLSSSVSLPEQVVTDTDLASGQTSFGLLRRTQSSPIIPTDTSAKPSSILSLENRIAQFLKEAMSTIDSEASDVHVSITPSRLHQARVETTKKFIRQTSTPSKFTRITDRFFRRTHGHAGSTPSHELTSREQGHLTQFQWRSGDNPFKTLEGPPPPEESFKVMRSSIYYASIMNGLHYYNEDKKLSPVLSMLTKLQTNSKGAPITTTGSHYTHQVAAPDPERFINKDGFKRNEFLQEMKKCYKSFLEAQLRGNYTQSIWHPIGTEMLQAIRSKMTGKQLEDFENDFDEIEQDMAQTFIEEYQANYSHLKITMCIDRPDLQKQWLTTFQSAKEKGLLVSIDIVEGEDPIERAEKQVSLTSSVCLPILTSQALLPEENLNPGDITYYQNRLLAQSLSYYLGCMLLNRGYKDRELSPEQIQGNLNGLIDQYEKYYETKLARPTDRRP